MREMTKARSRRLGGPGLRAWWLWVLLAGCLLVVSACGELRPVPEPFEAQAYKPIDYQELLDPTPAGLKAGDLVRVRAFFGNISNMIRPWSGITSPCPATRSAGTNCAGSPFTARKE